MSQTHDGETRARQNVLVGQGLVVQDAVKQNFLVFLRRIESPEEVLKSYLNYDDLIESLRIHQPGVLSAFQIFIKNIGVNP